VTPTAKGVVGPNNTKAMATATTTTTTVAVSTTAAIVARNPSRSLLSKNTAKSANAWTLKIKVTPIAKGVVGPQTTKAMATATTKTTTVAVSTTVVIAAKKQTKTGRMLSKNTVNNASAWIRWACKLEASFFFF